MEGKGGTKQTKSGKGNRKRKRKIETVKRTRMGMMDLPSYGSGDVCGFSGQRREDWRLDVSCAVHCGTRARGGLARFPWLGVQARSWGVGVLNWAACSQWIDGRKLWLSLIYLSLVVIGCEVLAYVCKMSPVRCFRVMQYIDLWTLRTTHAFMQCLLCQ